jgi:hypothetical protein
MSNLKKGFIATVTLLTVTATTNSTLQLPKDGNILQSKVQVGQVANAGYSEAGKWLSENKNWVIQNSFSWWTTQVYMSELSQNEVNKINEQYRGSAGIYLFNTALERALNNYDYPWYDKVAQRTYLRWAWHGRIENGKYNMYLSMSNHGVSEFKKRRGF